MIKDIKRLGMAAAFGLFAVAGFSACNTGTEPGETNVERSKIRDEGEMVGKDVKKKHHDDADTLDKYYEHADHKEHDDNNAKAIGDGAYDGKQ